MPKEINPDSSAVFLFPPCVDDWIGRDHPARFIADFIEALDLPALGFSVSNSNKGRPAYSNVLLLRVFLYCYFNRIRSMREMERACRDNVALFWLTGNHQPDHNTLWRFWRNNRKPLRRLLKSSLKVAANQGLVSLVLHAIDGTRIRAQASTDTALHRQKLENALRRIDADIDELEKQFKQPPNSSDEYALPEELADAEERRRRIREALQSLDEEGTDHLQPAEKDARMMKVNGRLEFGYNGQAVVEDQNGLVVASDVTNSGVDTGQLAPMLDEVKENLGRCADVTVADTGYSGGDDLLAAEGKSEVLANISEGVLPPAGEKPFHTSRFTFVPENDVMVCPLGQVLRYQRTIKSKNKKHRLRIYHCKHWRDCPRRDECSSNKRGRTVQIPEHQATIERHRRRHDDPEKLAMLKQRARIVEPTFGHVKERLQFRKWTLRTLDGVKTQWALLCLTLNLMKLYRHWLNGRPVLVN